MGGHGANMVRIAIDVDDLPGYPEFSPKDPLYFCCFIPLDAPAQIRVRVRVRVALIRTGACLTALVSQKVAQTLTCRAPNAAVLGPPIGSGLGLGLGL